MIEEILLYFIGALFVGFFTVYSWHYLNKIKINYLSFKFYFAIVFSSFVGTILAFSSPQYLRIIICVCLLFLLNYCFFIKNIKKAIISVLFSQLIIMLSEFILVLLIYLFINDDMFVFYKNFYNVLIMNVVISIVSFVFILTKFPNDIYVKTILLTDVMKQREVVCYCIIILLVATLSTCQSYLNWNPVIVLLINTILSLIFIVIVIKFANSESKYDKINSKYQTSISSLREYEDILDKYRVSTHENKNQLLTIKNMVSDEKVVNYIDALIDEKIKNNEKIINKTLKIPDGGFRAIIYAKLCKMEELKIKYKLNVANDVRTVDLIDMDEFLVRDACTILGVYLDNAIDAVKDLKKKNISVELYIIENNLYVDVTNNFEGKLDVDKIYKSKFTTKGEGHGYGLTLVSGIIRENKMLENECEINSNNITQRLIVKIKSS